MKAIDAKTFNDVESFPGNTLVEKFCNFEQQLAEETINDETIYISADIAIVLKGLEIYDTNIENYVGIWKGKGVYLKS